MPELKNVSFSYGDKAVLENFSLRIADNDRIALFGESGCGKTTVLRLLTGLEKPSAGSVIIPENYRISAVFQENRLLGFKTVLENIMLVTDDEKTARERLGALGLTDYADSLPKDLSGGMARRLAIARALSADFDLLVLDEPFTGLDASNTRTAAEYILGISGTRPILLVTHSSDEIALLGASVINMKKR